MLKTKLKYIFLTLLLLCSTIPVMAIEDNICLVCHESVNQERRGAFYIHPERCETCHIEDLSNAHGVDLQPSEITQVTRCVGCHKWAGSSHPMIEITKNIQELSLLNGYQMTCVTCHEQHASAHKYITRLDYLRDLCIVCHTDYK